MVNLLASSPPASRKSVSPLVELGALNGCRFGASVARGFGAPFVFGCVFLAVVGTTVRFLMSISLKGRALVFFPSEVEGS